MNPPSPRIRKRRAPQTFAVSRRRSTRIQSKERSVTTSHLLGSYYEPPSPPERPAASQTLQSLKAISHSRLPTCNDQTRKRKFDTSIETSAERSPKRARLTKKNLKAFEKMGGRKGKDSKSAQSESNSSRSRTKSKSSAATDSTNKTVSTTDSSFPRLAFDNGILDPVHSAPPENYDYLQDRLDRARDTASPTESEYKNFAYRIQKAPNEATVLLETSKLLKEYGQGYRRVYSQAFNNFPKDVGLNDGLSATQPDMVEGLDMTKFDPFPILPQFGGAAVPTTEVDPPTLSHLAGEWKGPGKDMVLAQSQAAYDGACMVYGRMQARSFLESPDPAGRAYIQTFTTDGTTLNTFAHYASKTEGQSKYHQYPTSSSFLVSSYKNHKESRRRLRNLQDDAKKNSEKLRDELNKKWSENQRLSEDEDEDEEYEDSYEFVPPPASAPLLAETVDSADCSSYNYENGEDPSTQLLLEHSTSFSANNAYEPLTPIAVESGYTSSYMSLAGNNQDDSLQVAAAESMYAPPYATQDDAYMQAPSADNEYTSLNASTCTPITPPHSAEAREDVNSNKHDHMRTRRTRTRASDTLEAPRQIDQNSKARKIHRKHRS